MCFRRLGTKKAGNALICTYTRCSSEESAKREKRKRSPLGSLLHQPNDYVLHKLSSKLLDDFGAVLANITAHLSPKDGRAKLELQSALMLELVPRICNRSVLYNALVRAFTLPIRAEAFILQPRAMRCDTWGGLHSGQSFEVRMVDIGNNRHCS